MGLGMWLGRGQERALPPGASLTAAGGAGFGVWAAGAGAGPLDVDAALRLPAVWAAVRLLADSVSTLPVHAESAGVRVATPPVLVEPAAGMPISEWLYAVMSSLLLRGNAFGLVTARSGPGMWPSQVELVHPDLVGVTADPITGVPTYRIGGRPFGRDEVWHVRAFTLPGVLLGMAPIAYGRQAIGVGLGAERFGAQFFGSGAVPSGVLTSTSPDTTADQLRAAKAAWLETQRTRTIAALGPGTDFRQLSINAEESQFLESQRFSVSQVARLFGLPVEMIGGDAGGSLTYSNTEARALDFVRYSLSPWLVRLETALGRLLPDGLDVRINADALLRGTTGERYDAHEVALRSGWTTVAEVRALEGLAPLPAPAEPAATRSVKDLRTYWTTGAGRARWAAADEPLTALYDELLPHMPADEARAAALSWLPLALGRPVRPADGALPAPPTPDSGGTP